jgi:hypothetical protein
MQELGMSNETLDKNYVQKIKETPGVNMSSQNPMNDTIDQDTVKKPNVMSVI